MKNANNGTLREIAREIGEEAARQVRGFLSELRRQVGSGWGVVRCVGKAPSELRFQLGVWPGARPLLGLGPRERRVAARA
jgi:hypothetical protein